MFATFLTAYLVFLGLVLGSFINLAADRVPRGESLVWPGSHCRTCGRRLNAIDLAPVLGYLLRSGRCATCRTPIGRSAPLIEASSGLAMLAPIVVTGVWPGAAVGLSLVTCLGIGVTLLAVLRHNGGSLSPPQ